MACSQVPRNTQTTLPKTSQYFKEQMECETFVIPCQKPDMEKYMDIIIWPEIADMRLIQTDAGISYEGQTLSGYKLLVEVSIKAKVTYAAVGPVQTMHGASFESIKSVFVVIPSEYNGKQVCDLFRAGRVSVQPYIEETCTRMMDCRTIQSCILLFVDVRIR